MDRTVVDLVAFAEAIAAENRPLSNIILTLRDAHSARTDLSMALDFLKSLDSIRQQEIESLSVAEDASIALLSFA